MHVRRADSGRRWARAGVGLALAACVLAACGGGSAGIGLVAPMPTQRVVAWPTPLATPVVVVSVATATPTPAVTAAADDGLQATLRSVSAGDLGFDPQSSKANALATLSHFANPSGPYGGGWWFRDDGRADIYEVLAVILYTEGHTSFDVRTAVAARYLWYCGGTGTACQGMALINFLAYFQPWREPWMSAGFLSDHAAQYEEFAGDLVHQRAGLLTAIIPGADAYVADADGLSLAGSIDWDQTQFHFANVHATWDAHLRERLRRMPNGPARLWVLTMDEAATVCGSRFLCPDMTQPKP